MAAVPQEPGLSHVDSMLDPLARGGDAIDRRRLVSFPCLDLGVNNQQAARTYFHDLTTGGAGLPVNVVAGGMKNDLSVVFDSSQQNEPHVKTLLGATPKAGKVNGATSFSLRCRQPPSASISPAT